MRRVTNEVALERELENLSRLDRTTLKERFSRYYAFEPPPRFSRKLMVRAVAYKLQEKVYGGLRPATRRLLLAAAKSGVNEVKARPTPNVRFKSGTVLMREWQGVTQQVTVLEDGFLFRGKRHRSLSMIARLITGTRWSGPAFFGLNKQLASGNDERI